ncbi:carbon-nitrogen hydrolase family protein [Pseudidiomarina woesei]|uniref:Predicted amidohydrolase n=1 Tax=Pseudidiomarina woesei TaxID=1381080 RepID=A0A0K6H8A0_9GAMM|nr:carbon-nitrogen hydrolase family protein [Pseudidiomarina woesei]CUA86988.1 Predicted amidohydrolase [Pseudidiomarina woesei]
MTSSASPQDNLKTIEQLLTQLPPQRPQLVVLPEACLCFGAGDQRQRELAEQFKAGPLQQRLAALAKQHGIWLVAGTMPIIDSPEADKFTAASLVFNPKGDCVARYNKIHLFDVDVADNTRSYRESHWTSPGNEVVTVDTEFGTLGLAVCYDVRFPELFRALRTKGADILVLPSAFTQVTGQAHWHVLTRARAIEQQCFMVAAAQVGEHANGRETYGHALVIDGWGRILAEATDLKTQLVSNVADMHELDPIRRDIPVAQHIQSSQKVLHASTKRTR